MKFQFWFRFQCKDHSEQVALRIYANHPLLCPFWSLCKRPNFMFSIVSSPAFPMIVDLQFKLLKGSFAALVHSVHDMSSRAAEVRVTFIRANQTWSAAVINTGARRRGGGEWRSICLSPPLPWSPAPGGIILYWNKPITGPGPIFWCATHRRWQHQHTLRGEEHSTDISSNGCPLVYAGYGYHGNNKHFKEIANRA